MHYAHHNSSFGKKHSQNFAAVLWRDAKNWFASSRFSNHVLLLLLTVAVLVFSPYLSSSVSGEQVTVRGSDALGEYVISQPYVHDLSNPIAYQVSHGAIVKANNPRTEENANRGVTNRAYQVEEGDTWLAVADAHGTTVGKLLAANDIENEDDAPELKPEEIIKLPIPKGITHKVAKGDTVETIADRYNADPLEIIFYNRIIDPEGMGEGREILLPGVTPPPTSTPPPTATPKPQRSYFASNKSSGSLPSSYQNKNLFGWPVNPSLVYQSTSYYGAHPGVDFASGGRNIPIYASASGVVTYAGCSRSGCSRSYGRMVDISHYGGSYTTRYAHFYQIQVRKGQYVEKGDQIGLMGTTGYSTGIHLHFEICTGSCSGYSTRNRVNPRRFF